MKNTNLAKKFLSVVFSVTFVICSIFLCSCDEKLMYGTFFEEIAEWVSDEMIVKTDGRNYFVFGTLTAEKQNIEVLVSIGSSARRMVIYNTADFDEKFINEIKQDQKNGASLKEIGDKMHEYTFAYSENVVTPIFSGKYSYKGGSKERVEFKIEKDNYSKTAGHESRVGETWVLTRHDLS